MGAGVLYIVSTPIGNLEDMTLRGLRVLKEADLIAAEDTRHTLKLLSHYGISKPLASYWGERERSKAGEILARLAGGQTVALVSDAGTPGISDPGQVLIREAINAGIRVVPIPGPSALLSALTIAGLPTDQFVFCGFLPAKASQRRKSLEELSLEHRTVVVYESPHRLVETLREMQEIFGERRLVLVREITKLHEEVIRGSAAMIAQEMEGREVIGECVLVAEGRSQENASDPADALAEISALMKKGLGRKEAVRRVAEAYGLSKKSLYDRSIGHDAQGDDASGA